MTESFPGVPAAAEGDPVERITERILRRTDPARCQPADSQPHLFTPDDGQGTP